MSTDMARLQARVEKLEKTVEFLMAHLQLHFDYEPESGVYASDEVRYLLSQGKKIEAIQVYREETGVDLKAAKEAIEAMPKGL